LQNNSTKIRALELGLESWRGGQSQHARAKVAFARHAPESGPIVRSLNFVGHDPKAPSMRVFGPLPERDLRDTA
jgi:hypothetical protein